LVETQPLPSRRPPFQAADPKRFMARCSIRAVHVLSSSGLLSRSFEDQLRPVGADRAHQSIGSGNEVTRSHRERQLRFRGVDIADLHIDSIKVKTRTSGSDRALVV
jgi:hypothetical protein